MQERLSGASVIWAGAIEFPASILWPQRGFLPGDIGHIARNILVYEAGSTNRYVVANREIVSNDAGVGTNADIVPDMDKWRVDLTR